MRGVILGCASDASQRKLRQLRQAQIHERWCQTIRSEHFARPFPASLAGYAQRFDKEASS